MRDQSQNPNPTPISNYYTSDYDRLWEMMNGHIQSQLIFVMAKLGIADYLLDAAKPISELASLTGIEATRLIRVLRGLVYYGFLVQHPNESFGLTSLGELLAQNNPDSLKERAIQTGELDYLLWGQLTNFLSTGETPFNHLYGMGYFEYLKQDPQLAENFHNTMSYTASESAKAILQAYDFSNVKQLVDVGGGQGYFLIAVLNAYPHLTAILLDEAPVAEAATRKIKARGLDNRCQVQAGNFFEKIPEGGDLYFLSWIIHDWEDAKALEILQNCRKAISNTGHLVLYENLIPAKVKKPETFVKREVIRNDLAMLALTGGLERTETEYRELLSRSGFKLTRIIPTDSFRQLIEAEPI